MIRQHAGLDVHVRVGGMTRHLIILLLLTAIVSMDPGPLHAADPVPPIELAPGVFYRNLDPAANQSFILFDSYVVVFDPGGIVEARNLLKMIRARTDNPIRFVIASHFHPDHSIGTAVFAAIGAEIVASEMARQDFEKWLAEEFARKAAGQPAEYAGLSFAPPTKWLGGPWVLDDGTQRLDLMPYEHGHTRGDLIGWMPHHRILFAQDLSTNGQHNLANASVSGWISVLGKLRMLRPLIVVPGHKKLAGPELLDKSHAYLTELQRQVGDFVARGMTYDQIMTVIDIPMYEAWSGVAARNEPTHVRRAYQEAGGPKNERLLRLRKRQAVGAGLAIGGLVVPIAIWRRRRRRTAG